MITPEDAIKYCMGLTTASPSAKARDLHDALEMALERLTKLGEIVGYCKTIAAGTSDDKDLAHHIFSRFFPEKEVKP